MNIEQIDKKIVKLKLDVIFKRVFGNPNNKDIIAAFVSALLGIPRHKIKKIYMNNVELTPEYLDQKFGRLDLKLDVDGKIVNIEIQVNFEPDFKDRSLFYWAKIYSGELKTGERYQKLKQTIAINIINFNLFECADYHSEFKPMEVTRHNLLSDKCVIHFFELKKVNKSRKQEPVEDWLDLINAETESDLMSIQNRTKIPEVQKTIVLLRELSGDEKVKQEAYYREKRLHDEASALGYAKDEGIEEGWKKGRAEGLIEGLELGKKEGLELGKKEGIEVGKKEGIEVGKKEGLELGKKEERALISRIMISKGYTEEQIKEILGEF